MFRAVLAVLLLSSFSCWSQSYPARSVKIVVPFAVGGPADIYGRFIGAKLSESLGQTFVVENRPGGGSIVGTDAVVKSAADGYTLLVMSNTHTVNETLIPKKPFELMKDLAPISGINYSDLLLVLHPSVPAKDLREFIALAKSQPGKLNYASSGPGTPYHMAGELFKYMAGVDIVHVPHKGSDQARTAILGGQVQMMFDAITTMAGQARAGKAEGARELRQGALGDHARDADRGRSWRARLRGHHLARLDGAGRNAAPSARSPERGSEQDRELGGREGSLGQAGGGADGDVGRSVRQVPGRGHPEVVQAGESNGDESRLKDKLEIIEVVHNWALWRDAGDWERFRTVWHDDGWMTATWFQGPAAEFIKVSKAGFDKGVSILHFLGGSTVDLKGNRAVAQTKMTINQRGSLDGETVDVVCTGRFYDFFEKRADKWGIVRRQPIYEKDRLDPVSPSARLSLDEKLLKSFPEGYRHLAYLQTRLGFQIKLDLPQLKGAEVETLYRHGKAWLAGAASAFPDR